MGSNKKASNYFPKYSLAWTPSKSKLAPQIMTFLSLFKTPIPRAQRMLKNSMNDSITTCIIPLHTSLPNAKSDDFYLKGGPVLFQIICCKIISHFLLGLSTI